MAQVVQMAEVAGASSYELLSMSWIYSLLLAAMSLAEKGATLVSMASQEMEVTVVEEALATTGMRSHNHPRLPMSEINQSIGPRRRRHIGLILTVIRILHTEPFLE